MTTEKMVRCVGLLDRTGRIQQVALTLPEELDLVAYERPADLCETSEPVDVLLVGPRELTTAGLRRVARWVAANPASLVIAHTADAAPGSDLLKAAGIRLRLRGPLTLRKLQHVLDRAEGELQLLAQASGRLRSGEEILPTLDFEPAQLVVNQEDEQDGDLGWEPAEAATGGGRLVTVASATGGSGKTFFAINLAALLAKSGRKVLLVDLDLQFGEVSAALQVKHGFSLYDGLYTAKGEQLSAADFAATLGELTARHPLGFDVLTAPRDPMLADYISARDTRTVLEGVRPHYDVVIADTPPSLNEVVITALDRSSLVVVLASLDVPSLRNLQTFLDVLARLHLPTEMVKLLLNKVDRDVGVTVGQAQDAFDHRFIGVLPLDQAVSRSINLGTTVVTHEPHTKVSRALVRAVDELCPDLLAGRIAPASEQAAVPAPRRNSAALLAALHRIRQGGNA